MRLRPAVKTLLGALFAVCVYRAFTQSLVFDEALTRELYIAAPLDNIFHYFDPNHHFLNTVLMRLSAAVFGDAEWALRLPALAGAALYFTAVYRIAAAAFGSGVSFALAVALLSLNPFVLDFMAAARGYGLALALLMWALALLLEWFGAADSAPRKLAWAGAALALSVTANLIFILPAASIAALTLYLLARRPQESGKSKREKKPPRLWLWFTMPIGGIAVLFLLMYPVENIHTAQLNTGAATLAESLRSLASTSLQHSGPLRRAPGMNLWRDAVAFVIAPAIVLAGLAFGLRRRNLLLLFTTVPLVFSALVLILMHLAGGIPYPAERTGIYFAPLACLALLALPETRGAHYALAAILAVQFLTEFNTRMFLVWEYDADTRAIGQYIASHRGPGTVRVGGSWQLSESLSYYLFRNQWAWMEIERRNPEPGWDYYTFRAEDAPAMKALGLKEVYRGPVSGSILAAPVR